ncbi:MAG: single-stranded DNA-binding protein [Verrucomicrobium sp.]|jgi:single-strand DNA-binding protein|nr:single-stranded DNA-binding protein [Verrucomicrobium sp.]
MASFNKVILAGNLTRDPELRYTPKGTAIAKLALAVNRRWTGEDGQTREEVTYVDIDAFGKQAEVISQYLRKGGGLLLEGRLKLDQWDDKQTGQKRSRLGVVLESFTFLGGRPEGAGSAPSAPPASVPGRVSGNRPASAAPAPADAEGGPPDDDDVPF